MTPVTGTTNLIFPLFSFVVPDFGNIVALRDRMQQEVGRVPFVWCFLMKHIIPHILIILFVNLAQSENADGEPLFGNYSGYPTKPYQILGMLSFVFVLFVFVLGVLFPDLYAPLALPQCKEAEMELSKYMNRNSRLSQSVKLAANDKEDSDKNVEASEVNEQDA
jgi:hypothetical protein